ncbi:uncharacterized protein KLLA0_B08547g [Kluyveromyces lactis]|uniref:KLLA0B08547p n=1 Tax=Kluyveromyces lactis (strain ATCC 8585 / CBS 2359 / DSM 70799 / NBRC 1267 / NRRL Y-1140 / WM37) TaxID=284590 RepID=Q6CVY0_KLULA|nr:uncharacterized protein KLLA0_B08547g [Kluyveromyces lactis]CAH02302.1 KLLA0B08547p [Kluyveromyces lactis]|eukprot:XP_451909.1 uncharacterized protein KLLA0_B08547g [Kluyveromyces lactis]
MSKRRSSEEHCGGYELNGNAVLCSDPPCDHEWVPIELYPSHVSQMHENVCTQCLRNFASEYWMELHIEEFHNPFKNGNYRLRCLEQDCSMTFSNSNERIDHLKRHHYYSDQFDFDILNSGC